MNTQTNKQSNAKIRAKIDVKDEQLCSQDNGNGWHEYKHVVLVKLNELGIKAEQHGEAIHELSCLINNITPQITLLIAQTTAELKDALLKSCDAKYKELDEKHTKKNEDLRNKSVEQEKSISNIKYAALGFGFAGALIIWLVQFIISRAVAHAG